MLNSSLSYECSVRLCDRLLGDRTNVDGLNSTTSASSRSDKIDMLYRLALARQPTSDEKNVLLEFVGETESQFETSFLAACLAIMNTNEFIYID
jgi:hypothetical protein